MGHKVNPRGFRLAINLDWSAKWYGDKHYAEYLKEDLKLRQAIEKRYPDGGIARVEIERPSHEISTTIFTARPGIVIGRGGQRVEETRQFLENVVGKKVRLNIVEIRQPELDAQLVARNVADQIERRAAFRRAMRQAIGRTRQAGALGIKIVTSGRLGGNEIARRETQRDGQVPLHTLRADIDYGLAVAHTMMGLIGVKVWIYKGEIIPPKKAAA